MFFRDAEKHTVLGLEPDGNAGGELALTGFVSPEATLNADERVRQYFDEMREPICGYVTATFGGERSQAEEITQDAFLQLYRYLSGGHVIHDVRAWTFRVAHNMAVNRIKAQQFIAPMSADEWDELQRSVSSGELNPEQTLLQTEKLERLHFAIGKLTLVERECLNLRTEGFRYREIGEILDITTRRVSKIIYRVIDKLAKELNGIA
jgi:RNA polymerase sigma-70 factor (ECF subfamily)